MNALAHATKAAHAAQLAAQGARVRIERPGTPVRFGLDVPAVVGQTRRQQFDSDGVETIVTSRDYLIAADDYRFGGELDPVAPQRGDVIVETSGECAGDPVTRRFTVLDIGGESSVRRSGPDLDGRWRIHTKHTQGAA